MKKAAVAALALLVLGGGAVVADTAYQKAKVYYNKRLQDEDALLVNGKVYADVQSLSPALQAFVQWDEAGGKLTIDKPNVHMILLDEENGMFGKVKRSTGKFTVYAQVDNLNTKLSEYKITLTDPYDRDTVIDGRTESDEDFKKFADSREFWIRSKLTAFEFKSIGEYKVRLWMKPVGGKLQLVSEKTISVS